MRYFAILLFLFFSTLYSLGESNPDSFQTGLTFKAHTYNQDERTALNLTPDQPFRFNNSYALNFKMKHLAQEHTYGYVFRFVINDTIHLDMVTNINGSKINFILGCRQSVSSNTEFIQQECLNQWLDVDVSITKDRLQFCINGKKQSVSNPYKQIKDIKILFGQNKHPLFFTTDVPPITIKEISIYSDNQKIRLWDMWKHRNNEVYDIVKWKRATVTNGIWEIDKHIKWQKDFSYKINSANPQVAYDKVNGRIFVANESQLLEVDLINKTSKSINISGGKPFIGVGSQLLYNSVTNKLISYSIEQKAISIYDFALNQWSDIEIKEQQAFQHHNRYIDEKRQRIITFGGYAFHHYNAIITELDLNTGAWSEKNLSSIITPRYLSAAGKLDDNNLLIMGGYGNKTGKQEESPINYYDLYKYNIETGTCSKLFDFVNDTQEHFTFSSSLVVDKNNVYALKYNNDRFKTSINLFRLNLESKKTYIWKDSIPYNFLDIQSFSDLVYCEKTTALYAIVVQKADNNNSSVEIYSIKYPLLEDADVLQKLPTESDKNWIVPFIIICLISIGGAIVFIYSRKKKYSRKELKTGYISEKQVTLKHKEKIEQSAIYLLGGFQTFSKKGEDTTAMFSPIIRQLFLCILMNTIKNGKGINSDELNEMFWFDMKYKNALNNRRVNISKLRLILKDIGNINVLNTNSYWHIELEEDIFCDYSIIIKLLKEAKETRKYEPENIRTIIDLASKGALLPGIQNEWIDNFKTEYSDLLINVLLEATKTSPICNDYKFLIDIANIILTQDNIDENGIRIKCHCLYQLGQKGLSKQVYDKFQADYKKLLKANPDLKYEDII